MLVDENSNLDDSFTTNFNDTKQTSSESQKSVPTSQSILNYLSTTINNTFLNSADIRIADTKSDSREVIEESTANELLGLPTDNEMRDITENINNIPSPQPPASSSSLSYQVSTPTTESTEIFENILSDVNDKLINERIDNDSPADTSGSIGSALKSTINYGYTTVLNLINSIEGTASSELDNIGNDGDFNQSDNSSLIGGAVTPSPLNDIVNLNRSYYHHLPPSLLTGHQYSIGYGSSQFNDFNSISNENDVSIMGGGNSHSGSSVGVNGLGVVVGSYVNSTIVNNLSDFLLNNNNNYNSTDEQYLIKLQNNNNNHELDDSDEFLAPGAKRDFVFDRTDVKIIFITLYSLVFCCCFFGNLLVILVVTLSRRLRSITNFFLANLAVADFCVGVFCVMQNLTIYLIDSWVFGKFLCKMYQFVHSLSYTASIFILVVICMERYFAIIHPITCKQILTPSRLRLVILGVWITSAVYSTPKFIFSKTITNVHTINGIEEDICILDRQMFNSELLDLINFGFLYVTPLLVMTILYSRIAIALWKSSRGLERHIALQNTSTCSPSYSGAHLYRKPSSMKYEKQHRGGIGITESQVSMEADKVVVTTWKKSNNFHQRHGTQVAQMSNSTNNVLRARRGVIRMLIIVVLTFALCNLPYHARKMWMHWSDTYKGYSNFNALFTPLTFLATYFNSGVNPLLYAFLSRNFRKGMRELLLCSFKKGKNKSSSMHQRVPLQEVASAVMHAVNLPLEKLKGGRGVVSNTSNNNDVSNKSLQHEDSNREQVTEIVSTEGI